MVGVHQHMLIAELLHVAPVQGLEAGGGGHGLEQRCRQLGARARGEIPRPGLGGLVGGFELPAVSHATMLA